MENIIDRLEQKDWLSRIVSTDHIPELEEEIEARHVEGMFDEAFFKECLTTCEYSLPLDLPRAKSIITVSVHQPQLRINFRYRGNTFPLIIPPTYDFHIDREVQTFLSQLLKSAGYSIIPAKLPLKLLTVRSGLGSYGRNNICYIPGRGSFHRIMAFYSDMPCKEDDWTEMSMMDRCEQCTVCLKACPTGAIAEDRTLLHAEQCLTHHNERKGNFPEWIDSSWHNCIVGCMLCQNICPENHSYTDWIVDSGIFSEEETQILLEPVSEEQLSAHIKDKLERLGLTEYISILHRNLSVMLEKEIQS